MCCVWNVTQLSLMKELEDGLNASQGVCYLFGTHLLHLYLHSLIKNKENAVHKAVRSNNMDILVAVLAYADDKDINAQSKVLIFPCFRLQSIFLFKRIIEGNKGCSCNQTNVIQGQTPDMENRLTQQRT